MNTSTVTLSTTLYVDKLYLNDVTAVTLNLLNVDRTKIPTNLKIRWGDTTPDETHTNDFFVSRKDRSILYEVEFGNDYPLFDTYTHTYYPSETALTRNLSCQALITYADDTNIRYVIPITLYSPSYYSKIGDIDLVKTNIVGTDKSILYTLTTKSEGFIIETVLDNTII